MMRNLAALQAIARQIRRDVCTMTTRAGSGHLTSSLSAVEIAVSLFFAGVFRADWKTPHAPNNDRFVLSKGHAAPLLYAVAASAGAISEKELGSLRRFGSRLEGHPSTRFPIIDAPTGSLGQGLSAGAGMALAARLSRLSYHTYVLLGDGEMSEGAVWETCAHAARERLGSLTAIVDVNRLGQSGATPLGWNLSAYERRFASFGWKAFCVDGHNLRELFKAFRIAARGGAKPVAIIAKTVKGKGVPFVENRNGWHGKALNKNELSRALKTLGPREPRITMRFIRPPAQATPLPTKRKKSALAIRRVRDAMSPREAFGFALVNEATRRPHIVACDADVKNSTYLQYFARAFPKRFFECGIAEQHMVAMALGFASRGYIPVVATFAAFLMRAFDQIRMAQYAHPRLILVGTHGGVSVGADGPSQMGLEDIAMMRTIRSATVLSPSDAFSTEQCVSLACTTPGIVYLRLMRNPVPSVLAKPHRFSRGGSRIVRNARHAPVTIFATGVTVQSACAASDVLVKERIGVRVIDCYCVKPIDTKAVQSAARTSKALLVVEDHVPEGGLADAVRSALPQSIPLCSLAVTKEPRSGTPAQLLAYEGIDEHAIVRTVLRMMKSKRYP
jgi:transketolase